MQRPISIPMPARVRAAARLLAVTCPLLLGAPALAAPLPDVSRPLKTGATAPLDAAVIVGIEQYYELPKVPHAERDAAAFADFLIYTRGVPPDRVKRVPKANREKLLSAVQAAADLAGPEGTVWVYFAGHGGASPETGERMLMGVDVQPDLDSFAARSIEVSTIRSTATAQGAKAVLILDTCYTGQGRSGAELLPGKRFAVPSYAADATPQVLEWSAASPNQFSGPLPAARHGAFTYAVIGALRGWADGQLDDVRDGQISAHEASLYVESALRTLNIHDQVPVLVADAPGDWVLADHPKSEPAPDLHAVTLDAQPAPQPAAPVPTAVAAPAGRGHGARGRAPVQATVAAPAGHGQRDGARAPGQTTVAAPGTVADGEAMACFKRKKMFGASGAKIAVEVDEVEVTELRNGQTTCITVAPGTRTISTWWKPRRKSLTVRTVEFPPESVAWFLVQPFAFKSADCPTCPGTAQVSEVEYNAEAFDLVK